MLWSVFLSPSSFFLLVCLQQVSPTITVDKLNVLEPGVLRQEGFWSAAVDFYQHQYQPTDNPPPPPPLHKYVQSHSAKAASGCVDRCLSGLFDISVPHLAANVSAEA